MIDFPMVLSGFGLGLIVGLFVDLIHKILSVAFRIMQGD